MFVVGRQALVLSWMHGKILEWGTWNCGTLARVRFQDLFGYGAYIRFWNPINPCGFCLLVLSDLVVNSPCF